MTLGKKPFENNVGYEENAGSQFFLCVCFLFFFSFPTMFSTLSKKDCSISVTMKVSSANPFNPDKVKS